MKVVLDNMGKYEIPESVTEYKQMNGYSALEKALGTPPKNIVETVKASGLRGRGGAGYPTGVKWEYTASAPSPSGKYVLCNADEGEPGTFKDRVIMEEDPHKVLEGIIICGYAVGANKGYVYIRGEYKKSIKRMKNALQNARDNGYLGEKILGSTFCFDITMRKGGGSYICGEKTAMISSLEGKRGIPKFRPPYPATHGLWGKPSVVNNVETLANIPAIVQKGSSWYKTMGTKESPGTKVYSVSGMVNSPGVYEFPMDITLQKLLFEHCNGIKNGKQFKAALVGGGASGAFLHEESLHVKLNFEDLKKHNGLLGTGAVLVLDEDTDIIQILRSIAKFFAHESCGLCVPCRVGTARILDILTKIEHENSTDFKKIRDIAHIMNKTSVCQLGRSVITPLSTGLDLVMK